jgi:hypothetical protein
MQQKRNIGPDMEEGEVSSDSDYEGASDTIVTPKKTGRGRKSKKGRKRKGDIQRRFEWLATNNQTTDQCKTDKEALQGSLKEPTHIPPGKS